jgi:hypothetical protein
MKDSAVQHYHQPALTFFQPFFHSQHSAYARENLIVGGYDPVGAAAGSLTGGGVTSPRAAFYVGGGCCSSRPGVRTSSYEWAPTFPFVGRVHTIKFRLSSSGPGYTWCAASPGKAIMTAAES